MRRLIPFAALPVLAACAGGDRDYPSLLPRPIEGRSQAEPVREDAVAQQDAALDRRIAEQRALADAAAKRFRSAAQEVEVLAALARGTPIGSERWIRAQTSLAELAPIRGQTTQIVTGLEEIAIARASAGEPAYRALDAAISEIGAAAQQQGDRVAALEDALGG